MSVQERMEAPGFTSLSHVIKRDGRCVSFESEKITRAIHKASRVTGEFGEDVARELMKQVLLKLKQSLSKEAPSVEDIQDIVEDILLCSEYKKTAKAYILYREQHRKIRDLVQKADMDLIDSYLDRLDWRVNENSNMAYSLQGLNNYISNQVTEVYWLNKIYDEPTREAHLSGDFHIHDLGLLSVYCVGWDLQDLLKTGFKGAYGKAESRPARHFRSALGQIVNFFYTLQGEAAGAQAFSNLDTLLAPFIRYDQLSYKDVKQAIQEFVFNLNVPTRVGFQTPFTNITMDLCPPRMLRDHPVIVGGELQKETYGEFQEEMNLLNRAFLEVMSEGDAKGRVFTFPIPTYNITSDFDWESPDIENLWEVTGRYGIPYFSNYINSDISPEDARSMCCRLRLDTRQLNRRGGGLFGANPLTGSIGVVTLNMPRLGFVSQNEQDFFKKLDRLMVLASASLEVKRKILEVFTEKNLYPYTRFYLRDIKQRFGCYWKNHFSTIGLVGMNEACMNLLGVDIGSTEGREFSCRVLDYMRNRLEDFQEETGNLYNLEATPAEGAGYRMARLDKDKYSGILFADNTPGAEPFYTNSTQLPVNYSEDIFEVLDLQDELQTKYTGGTVLHMFMGESVSDPAAVRQFIKKVCTQYKLPYFTMTPSFSICPNHGYLIGEVELCPECSAPTEIYSRVVGYLRPVNQWNLGKKAEFAIRSHYHID